MYGKFIFKTFTCHFAKESLVGKLGLLEFSLNNFVIGMEKKHVRIFHVVIDDISKISSVNECL